VSQVVYLAILSDPVMASVHQGSKTGVRLLEYLCLMTCPFSPPQSGLS